MLFLVTQQGHARASRPNPDPLPPDSESSSTIELPFQFLTTPSSTVPSPKSVFRGCLIVYSRKIELSSYSEHKLKYTFFIFLFCINIYILTIFKAIYQTFYLNWYNNFTPSFISWLG